MFKRDGKIYPNREVPAITFGIYWCPNASKFIGRSIEDFLIEFDWNKRTDSKFRAFIYDVQLDKEVEVPLEHIVQQKDDIELYPTDCQLLRNYNQ